ncbi:NfeD family protein [Limnobacter humi]|uniref:NfeD family protein n=1 Tax=Limnobacter humi TaxID=1778671 RepID=A0ABT1WGZ6_9BURK|nr:NfeD family protein [Limnobacter humi]MCQ8896017.1 NfeD family protein [Limnobacter humi]
MGDVSFWLVFGGVLLIAELTTGTFYLLMVALGAFLGALVAYFGYSVPMQVAAAGVFSVAATLGLKNTRKNADRLQVPLDQSLDIGNTVRVDQWQAGHHTQVQYRGAQWSAESVDQTPVTGTHTIVAVQGNLLKIKKSPPF